MNSELKSAEIVPTDDQKAVNEYFASGAYEKANRRRNSNPGPRRWSNQWSSDWLDLDLSPALSFVLGLAGLNLILLVFACMAPLAIYSLENAISPSDGFFVMMAFIQTIMFPPIISFSFATVTPMFWYGSVAIRFAVGFLLVVPGCLAFCALVRLLDGGPPDDFWFQFSGVMFTQFLVAGTIALLIQMWSPWTLTHERGDQSPLPPLGTMAILELTGVAAIGCAVFMFDGFGEILEGVLFFAGIGGLSSLAVIAVLIAFLREHRRNFLSGCVGFAAALAMAALMCSFFAIQEFGWNSVTDNLLFVTATSIYGAVVISAVMWICVGWLRVCGWRCVNRNLEKNSLISMQKP